MYQVAVDIEEDSAVESLVDNVGLEDLVVERLRCALGGRHFGCELCNTNKLLVAEQGQLGISTRGSEKREGDR